MGLSYLQGPEGRRSGMLSLLSGVGNGCGESGVHARVERAACPWTGTEMQPQV